MAFISLVAGDIDAESPLSDDLFTEIKDDLDWLKSALSDGVTASQDLTVNKITVRGSGTAVQVYADVNITGTLTVGTFVVPETALIFLPLWD